MFQPSVIFACCNQAVGIIDMKIHEAEEHEGTMAAKVEPLVNAWRGRRRGEPGRYGPIIATAVLSIVGTLVTAWLVAKFGWYPNS